MVLLSPLLLAALLKTLTQSSDVKPVGFAVCAGPDSGIVRSLQSKPQQFDVRLCQTEAEALELLRRRQVAMVCLFPPDFDSNLLQHRRPTVRGWTDPSRPTQVALGRAYLRGALREQAEQADPARIEIKKLGGAGDSSGASWLASAVLLACMSAMVINASNLVEEKEAGTLQQILLSPADSSEVWIGKLAVSAALGTFSAWLVFALHGLSPDSLPGALGLTLVGSFVFAAAGGVVGLLANGAAAASSWTGFWFIVFFAPASLSETSQTMSRWAHLSPAYYLYDGVQRSVLAQESAVTLAEDFAVLLLLALLLTAVGARLVRRHR